MNTSPTPCKHCRFYHGADRLVCAVHPHGPTDPVCSDFEARLEGQSLPESYKRRVTVPAQPWDVRRKLLVASLLFSCIGYGVALWWVEADRETEPTIGPAVDLPSSRVDKRQERFPDSTPSLN